MVLTGMCSAVVSACIMSARGQHQVKTAGGWVVLQTILPCYLKQMVGLMKSWKEVQAVCKLESEVHGRI